MPHTRRQSTRTFLRLLVCTCSALEWVQAYVDRQNSIDNDLGVRCNIHDLGDLRDNHGIDNSSLA